MTAAPNTQTEKQFQAVVTKIAKANQWRVFHVGDSRKQTRDGRFVPDRGIAGFPDLVLVRERVIFAELKREKAKPTSDQAAVLQLLENAGAETYLWRPSDLEGIENILRKKTSVFFGRTA